MSVKQQLYKYCSDFIKERTERAEKAMKEAQSAANEEGKNSAGDKYETGRAMMQIERDKHAAQLAEARKAESLLSRINPDKSYSVAKPGSLVETSQGNYFISISAGKTSVDNKTYFLISPVTPLAKALADKEAGEEVSLNGRKIKILSID